MAGVDVEAAASHLRRWDPSITDVQFLGAGAWSTAYSFDSSRGPLVARFGPHADDFVKDAVASLLEIPAVPRILVVTRVDDEFVAIGERCEGSVLETADEIGWRVVMPSLFSLLDALGRVDESSVRAAVSRLGEITGTSDCLGRDPLADLLADRSWRSVLQAVGDEESYARLPGWRAELAGSPIGVATFDHGVAILGALAERVDPPRSLVHSDLINRNVLVAGGQLSGVFDWGCAFVGDGLYDIAWIEFWSPWYPALRDVDVRREWAAHAGPIAGFDDRMRACCLHIGLTHLPYNASIGDTDALMATERRLVDYL